MGKEKSLTIHKANEIVRGGDNLSVYGKRAVKCYLLFRSKSMLIKAMLKL